MGKQTSTFFESQNNIDTISSLQTACSQSCVECILHICCEWDIECRQRMCVLFNMLMLIPSDRMHVKGEGLDSGERLLIFEHNSQSNDSFPFCASSDWLEQSMAQSEVLCLFPIY